MIDLFGGIAQPEGPDAASGGLKGEGDVHLTDFHS